MQEVEAPTERSVLIGCLETIASGTGISMHKIHRVRETQGEITAISQRVWGIVLLTLTFTFTISIALI